MIKCYEKRWRPIKERLIERSGGGGNIREFGEEVRKEVIEDMWINRYCEKEMGRYREGDEERGEEGVGDKRKIGKR